MAVLSNPRSHGFILLCFLSVVLLKQPSTSVVEARSLPADVLALGVWDVQLLCKDEFFSQELFPPKEIITSRETVGKSRRRGDNAGGSTENRRRHLRSMFDLPKPHRCNLYIFPNGTFAMLPSGVSVNQGQLPTLAVHGKWQFRKNPYCATDRFYDELLLTSYPRIQKEVLDHKYDEIGQHETHETNSKTNASGQQNYKESLLLRKVQLQLQCRLQGRHTSLSTFHRGRISHGTVTLQSVSEPSRSPIDKSQNGSRLWLKLSQGWGNRRITRATFTGNMKMRNLKSLFDDDDDALVL